MKKNEIKVGTPVICWSVKENGETFDPIKTTITSEPLEIDGQIVCKIDGKPDEVPIGHLDPITAGSLLAAQLKGLKEISEDEVQDATRNFFESRGVNIKFT